jgi:predicted alpha/beta superfamily hydrolase
MKNTIMDTARCSALSWVKSAGLRDETILRLGGDTRCAPTPMLCNASQRTVKRRNQVRRSMLRASSVLAWTMLFSNFQVSAAPAGESNHDTPPSAKSVQSSVGLAIQPRRRMRAEGFPWEHEIQIALPASYATTNKAYPVLWVTDGAGQFEVAVRIANQDVHKYVPEMIIVGIGEVPEWSNEGTMRRVYDFSPNDIWKFDGFGSELVSKESDAAYRKWGVAGVPLPTRVGGAPAFLKFLVDVVRPALARQYRMLDEHILFGDSTGGIFCTYALLSRPEAFEKYICGSPALWMGKSVLFEMEERYAQEHRDLHADVFFGAGEGEVLEDGVGVYGFVSSMTRMAEILKARAYPSLRLHVRIFRAETHGEAAPRNLRCGLRALYEEKPGTTTHSGTPAHDSRGQDRCGG